MLLSPSGGPEPFYAEFGWTNAVGGTVKVPAADTVWTQVGSGALSATHPVTLTYDNGQGIEFRRIIKVDDKYLFTIKDEVVNKGASPISLYPYALISRHGTPPTLGYYILHEGMVGVLGDQGLQEYTYKKIEEKKDIAFDVTNGWLGFTDKYFAAALLPDTTAHLKAHYNAGEIGTLEDLPDRLSARRRQPSRRARPARPTRGSSPAPRKSPSSTPTRSSSSSTASIC